jgi:transposase
MIVDTMKAENCRVAVEPVRVSCNGKRFFSEGHKRMIVAKCLVPGASVSAVALAHGFNTNLVRKWIAKHQARRLPEAAGELVPVRVIEAPTRSPRRSRVRASKRDGEVASGAIEIQIGAARVILRGKVAGEQLHLVLAAVGLWR